MKANEIIREALDKLAAALVKHNHKWSKKERTAYNKAIKALPYIKLDLGR